jgi:hypothetical protein
MFQKALPTGSTDITPLFQNQSNLFSKVGNILDFLKAIIMNAPGFLRTAGAYLFSRTSFDVDL